MIYYTFNLPKQNFLHDYRFVVGYLGAMHLLMFAILYYNAHYVHYGCEPVMPAITPQQVQQLWR
jgi:hypothetical protein